MSVELIRDGIVWDRFIDESPYASLFHKWGFLKIIAKYTGYELRPYGIFLHEEMVGAVPVFIHHKAGMRLVYSPPPSSLVNIPYMGMAMGCSYGRLPAEKREEHWNFAVEEIERELKRISPAYISIGLMPAFYDVRPFIMGDYEADLQYTYIIDLERPIDHIWESIEKDCKKSIREAAQYPLTIERSYDTDAFMKIMTEGLKKVGTTFFNRQAPGYLKEIVETFPDNVKMYFLYNDGSLIGGNIICGYGGHCIGWMGNTAMDGGAVANEYLLWEILKKVKEEGYRTFENSGADEKRLNFSKTKFNPDLKPCMYVMKKGIMYKTAKYGYGKLADILNR